MKKTFLPFFSAILIAAVTLSGCYKLQKDYKYEPSTLDPSINMSAKDFLLTRGVAGAGSDSVFKWMQLGLEYAEIDLAEFERPGRTFIFLHNNAIRATSGSGATLKVSGGFFFDYPIYVKDALGNHIKSLIDPTADSVRPALTWSDYPKQLVKNYFSYLILQGEYSFDNLGVNNTSVPTLLAPGATANPNDSKLGWVVTRTTPNPDAASASIIVFNQATGTGFDPEGKINLKLINNQNAPINVNDRTDDRTAGYIATNGKVHVYDKTVHPFRYSY
ncbi:hypothetical protein EPD60_00125 [Flaviaesturariibacter flavus]|uniref:Uncharacterized protein n=1 Tax=Flaviaesturariibacter flavus TaxID=2502780 RepID=A0A4R1BQM3_9BACT|nr:hypothetical protein [Flaviaesturariibacter flavus]TCJ19566.1 hypothetical protein EPD60_00125 [Flaviaesturariibacter flavus]